MVQDWLEKNWAVVSANPWVFVQFFVIVSAATFGFVRWWYMERIDLLKARIDGLNASISNKADRTESVAVNGSGPDKFEYPASGLYGLSILALGANPLVVGQSYSMAAVVPAGCKLRVQILGPGASNLASFMGAWTFGVPPRNWIHQDYVETTSGAEQWFDAVPGEADLKFMPQRGGTLILRAYEGGAEPVWERRVPVREADRRP